MNTNFTIDSRYEIIDALGSGAYGFVVSAKDTKASE
jgi:serine/threonine protein kinase